MAGVARIQREDIINTAFEIVKEKGMEGLNARDVAKKLNCSIQPIFYQFSNMEELKQKQQNGAIIIDVRSVQEYNEGHLNYAKNIPDYKINNNIVNIIQNKNQEILLYCESGTRSKKAYKKLTKYGYTNVYNLYGGLENY